jgi:hypothetical protein
VIASALLRLHRGQDVSRSVLIGEFLALLIAAPLVRRLVKRSLERARLWGRLRLTARPEKAAAALGRGLLRRLFTKSVEEDS